MDGLHSHEGPTGPILVFTLVVGLWLAKRKSACFSKNSRSVPLFSLRGLGGRCAVASMKSSSKRVLRQGGAHPPRCRHRNLFCPYGGDCWWLLCCFPINVNGSSRCGQTARGDCLRTSSGHSPSGASGGFQATYGECLRKYFLRYDFLKCTNHHPKT